VLTPFFSIAPNNKHANPKIIAHSPTPKQARITLQILCIYQLRAGKKNEAMEIGQL